MAFVKVLSFIRFVFLLDAVNGNYKDRLMPSSNLLPKWKANVRRRDRGGWLTGAQAVIPGTLW